MGPMSAPVSRALTTPMQRDLEATLAGLVALAVAALGADAAAIYLLDPEDGDLRLAAACGLPAAAIGHRLALGEGLIGRVAAEGRSLASPDASLDLRAVHRRADWDAEPPVRAFLGAPLRAGALVIGALEVLSHAADRFSVEDRGHAAILADAAALLIEQTRLVATPPPAALQGDPLTGSDPIGVATLDRQLRVTGGNATFSRLVGLPIEAVIGRPALTILPGLGRPRARDALAAALHGTPGHLSGVHAPESDTAARAASLSLSLIPFGDAAGTPAGVILAIQDLSAPARLEAELQAQHARALEARDRLRAVIEVVSHELRTPLTSVLGYARLLVDRPEVAVERRVHWAGLVLEKARLMARLVDEVTDLARMGSARFALHRSPTDVAALATGLAADLDAGAERHQIVVAAAPGLPLVPVDRDRIAQVLTNLLTNAIKFWPEGGVVQVRVYATADSLVVEVEDHGPGVPPELAEQIFEPFYRVESGTGQRVAGTGLGLAVSRGIVEAHGGHIACRPVPDGGACFRFTLPLGPEADAGEPPAEMPRRAGYEGA
jgi:signal transduction histidine kinase